ncbi:MAG: S41 family peptidase [Flavobacteriales bacterium]|jgi:carboxyl-terminal processing protease|nr:S41 family peptidase [Flavobacteriales bacterium]MCB9364404.1 S41 family peptidase [Flavobacteriales bacterium]
MKNRVSKIVLIVGLAISSVVSVGYVDSYFEVSKNLDIFATLFRELNIYYVDDSDPGKLMKTGIDAMLKSLDPYTNYIPESNIEDYKMMTTGQYGGIGALIQKQGDYVIISEPYEGFGAFKAGLIAGDKILEVDGKSVKGKSTTDIREFLLGQPGTSIELKIERPGTDEPMLKKVVREEVKIKDVPYFGMVADSVGYIKLSGFTETASAEVKEAFHKLKEENMQSLVLDLRGNGGGLLKEAVAIVNFFVPKGADIVNTKGKIKDWDKSYVATLNPIDMNIPIVVLIDGGSASASEIVSGSLQDNDRAVVMGTQSFGKGLVQSVRPLSYNSKLKVTVAKYYTPSGRCIQKLDYAHRDDEGKVNEIADSLITEFKTVHNKRPVFDGKGITPDVEIKREPISILSVSLLTKSLFFNFATEYRLKHETIAPAKEFQLSDEDYNSFKNFLSDKDYDYTTESEDLLASLEKTTKEEKYFDDVKEEYELLRQKLSHHKNDDLNKFKDEITKILQTEIVSRYYYQKGQIEISLKNDTTLNEAIKTLGDKELYNSILAGTNK